MLQTHFALYSNVATDGAPVVGFSTKTVKAVPAIVAMRTPLRRAKTIFLVFAPLSVAGYLSHHAPPRRSARTTASGPGTGRSKLMQMAVVPSHSVRT